MQPGPRVTVYEVAPRDGLQNEPDVLESEIRAELVRRLAAAGLSGGVETGIDLDALIAVSAWLEGGLGRRLEGQLYRAGPFPLR